MTTQLQEAMAVIRKYAPTFYPKVGLILGSGLGSIAEQITHPITIPYQAIPGLQAVGVAGHASLLIMGQLNGIPVVCLKGRLHLYEGASYESIRTLIRIVKQLGAHSLLVTAAVGSVRPEVGPGEVVIINDHINFQPGNPLVGHNDESIGPRFVSMEEAYDMEYRQTLLQIATNQGFNVTEGVYFSTLGPSFETPAEVRAYQTLGADVIGMSVVSEVIIARHCGLRVAGLAAVTNLAVGMSEEKVTHEGTLQFGEITARKLVKIIPEFIKSIGSEI
jgi:xanthosine phosphorylase